MAVTFGGTTAPSQVTLNLDSLFGTSLAAYRKELIDNIGATNAFFNDVITKELYESQDGGAYIQEPLMYALQTADSYDGYDELPSIPPEGITDSIWEWRQCASAIVYSMKEVKMNKQRLVNLVKTRIQQAEMGLQEFFAQALMFGAATQGGAITSPYQSTLNSSYAIEPLSKLIAFDPTTSVSVGNINQNTYAWWRNKTRTSAATTYQAYLLEVQRLFNTCALGTGGKPTLCLLDQTSYELFCHALYQQYRYTQVKVDEAFPFENVVYKGAHFVMDDKVPDVYSGTIPTLTGGAGDPASLTYGSMFAINVKFFKMRYESDSDFQMLKDESGKTIFKPITADSRIGHVAWMGNLTVSNRRKHGVLGKIPRTLTIT